MDVAIEAKRLHRVYKTQQGAKDAIKDVSFTLPYAAMVGVLGPNGAGKTTLIKLLATILQPTSGSASVAGLDIKADSSFIRSQIGYAGQNGESSCYGYLSGIENLWYFSNALHGVTRSTFSSFLETVNETLNIKKVLAKRYEEMSGGEKQLVIILRALIHNPKIVFLDEPTRSLDPSTARAMRSFLSAYTQKYRSTFIISTHNLEEVQRLYDMILFINNGQVMFCDTTNEFIKQVRADTIIEYDFSGVDETAINELAKILRSEENLVELKENGTLLVYTKHLVEDLKRFSNTIAELHLPSRFHIREPSVEDAYALFINQK